MMSTIVTTKLFRPRLRPDMIRRPHLVERLEQGLHRKVSLISAPAGFGKTTLASEWLSISERPSAWLSLEPGDSEPLRFLRYLTASLQTVMPALGQGLMQALHGPQPPPPIAAMTALLNELAGAPTPHILVLDDLHTADAPAIDELLGFLLQHQPPHMHLVLVTREDPPLPLARLRAQDQLTELRMAALSFAREETTSFLQQMVEAPLSSDDIAALERRTEGWIAGLQLAGLSLKGCDDITAFVERFSGSHHFVMDYLLSEVMQQQPEPLQRFLLSTSILDRMCGSLCDAVVQDPSLDGSDTLLDLARANLFIVPLDQERRWYRYHHLFGDLLRQRLHRRQDAEATIAALHQRASGWLREHGLLMEAFHHAVAADDTELAAQLVEGDGMPLHFLGDVGPILGWLSSLSDEILDARPSLRVLHASAQIFISQTDGVTDKLEVAEAAMAALEDSEALQDLHGHIAAIRATLAVSEHCPDAILEQSSRALTLLSPQNLPIRTAMTWARAFAQKLQGDRSGARKTFAEAIAISRDIGHLIIHLMSTMGLGHVLEADTELHEAAQTYREALALAGTPPLHVACAAHLGLARIHYQWDDLDAARRHGELSLAIAEQVESSDRSIPSLIFLARLALAQGKLPDAASHLATAEQRLRRHQFLHLEAELAEAQIALALARGDVEAAAGLSHEGLPLSQARVQLAQRDPQSALATLDAYRAEVESKGWEEERLRAMALQIIAQAQAGQRDEAMRSLDELLALTQGPGHRRLFLDEGPLMAELLTAKADTDDHARALIEAMPEPEDAPEDAPTSAYSVTTERPQPLVEPLSQRERQVLHWIAQGLTNAEIGAELCIALSTVKGHTRNLFGKLGVRRRTEAIAKARQLGLLS